LDAQPPNLASTSVRISSTTHARVVLACETLQITVPEFMERASLASPQQQEELVKIRAYCLATPAAEAARQGTHSPESFGLPCDFGIPLHPEG
jgi:hypothetical protein